MKTPRLHLHTDTNNGYRQTLALIKLLWQLSVITEYQCFYAAEKTTNTIYFWLPHR